MVLPHTNRIPRLRRTYNRWVANQTLEDCALRFTSYKVRRFSNARIANTAIGGVSFLALEAIGGAITLQFGFTNALMAIATAALVLLIMGIPISYYAAKYGVDIDLLTRGAGFGYIGSTVTSLIYASFTFIFFAIEAAIIASALELCAGIPLSIGYIISALAIIPMVTHGVTFISRLQAWTQPVWVVLQLAPFIYIALQGLEPVRAWSGYTGLLGPLDGGFQLSLFGAACAILFSLSAQIGEQVDYLRFLPPPTSRKTRFAWWAALLAAGPGWVVLGALKITAGSFLAYYAFQSGESFANASDPTRMYLAIFRDMLASPEFALGVTGIFVVICQVKINVTNTYAGSIAWSNFFSRLTHSHPGRVVWVVFNVMLGLLLMEFGVYRALEQTLGLYSIVALAWVASIFADLVINKPLGLSPKAIEFKRAHLFDINPVGFFSMSIAALLGLVAYLGGLGETLSQLYSFVTLGSAIILAPLIALVSGSKYYVARTSIFPSSHTQETHECCICGHEFDQEDMAYCPVYSGPICSLCCSLDARCGDRCKTDARLQDQISVFAQKHLNEPIAKFVESSLFHYLTVLSIVLGVMGLVFVLIHFQSALEMPDAMPDLEPVLIKLFVIMSLIAGVVVWLFVLAHENRRFAEEESHRHTQRLINEISAHEETDRQLQKAKEAAESANIAKSKYVVGLSHELRSPLSTILGYAQLMERDKQSSKLSQNAATSIRRNGDHLAGLIEGLLDISKIEAGKIEIFRQRTSLSPFLDQLVDMFTLQAESKGIGFNFSCPTGYPDYVYTDEKRLRQVLINLLTNAVKFTEAGDVSLTLRYRTQIATFEIRDTGIGIHPDDVEKVFLPFERGRAPSEARVATGTGLGLTITRLLVEIMGGELTLESVQGEGSLFRVKIMLSAAEQPRLKARTQLLDITGYHGPRRNIAIADDDPFQRTLLTDILTPLGFNVLEAQDGIECLEITRGTKPDLVILDISMPGLNGWEVARELRSDPSRKTTILMLSADVGEERNKAEYLALHDGYLMKPVQLTALYEQLSTLLDVQWRFSETDTSPEPQTNRHHHGHG